MAIQPVEDRPGPVASRHSAAGPPSRSCSSHPCLATGWPRRRRRQASTPTAGLRSGRSPRRAERANALIEVVERHARPDQKPSAARRNRAWSRARTARRGAARGRTPRGRRRAARPHRRGQRRSHGRDASRMPGTTAAAVKRCSKASARATPKPACSARRGHALGRRRRPAIMASVTGRSTASQSGRSRSPWPAGACPPGPSKVIQCWPAAWPRRRRGPGVRVGGPTAVVDHHQRPRRGRPEEVAGQRGVPRRGTAAGAPPPHGTARSQQSRWRCHSASRRPSRRCRRWRAARRA